MGARLSDGQRLQRKLNALYTEGRTVQDKISDLFNYLSGFDAEELEPPIPHCATCKQELPEQSREVEQAFRQMNSNVDDFFSDLDMQASCNGDFSYLESALEIFARLDKETQDAIAAEAKDVL